MKVHCFDPKLAKQVGMAAAVIFYHISFWIDHNAKNEQNFRDGRYWTYNSVKAFSLQFRYLTPKQIRTALDRLVTSGLIIKAEHNVDRSDRTTWYALGDAICPEGQADLPGEANEGVAPQGSSKENRYKPDKEPPSRAEAREQADPNFDKVWHAYPADRRRNWAASRDVARAAIDRGEVSPEELQSAVAAWAGRISGLARALFDIAQVQCPTGTLPTNDVQLARLLRFDVTRFKELRAMDFGPLRGWVSCLCGNEVRLMHPVVVSVLEDAMARREAREAANTEKAVAQRIKRLREALSGLGLSAAVLQDQRLIDRMDGWLLENNPGQRRAAFADQRAVAGCVAANGRV